MAKRLVIFVIALFVGLVALITVPIGLRQMQIARRIHAVRASGAPAGIDDLQSAIAWDQSNAAWHLDRAQKEAEKLFTAIAPVLYSDETFDWRNGLSQPDRDGITSAFENHPSVMTAVDSAIRCDRYFSIDQPVTTASAFQQKLLDAAGLPRTIQRTLACRCRFLAAIGEYEQAASLALKGLHLVRLQEQDPTIVNFMVAAACRNPLLDLLAQWVASGKLDAKSLAMVDTELRRHDAMSSFVHALTTERALGIELSTGMTLALPASQTMLPVYLEYMREQIALGAVSHFEEAAPIITAKATELAVVAPSMNAGRALMNRQRAKIRCLRLLIALHVHAIRQESNRLASPESQNDSLEIAPNLDEVFAEIASHGDAAPQITLTPKDVLDPFTGQPLVVKPNGSSWLIYSVGENEIDDGGTFQEDLDVGVPPQEQINI
ncbi:MAG: hypothetical protein ACF8CQ_22370 [Rhodopirellula sp. JB044]|uniref:hypothetical protein n=1 Tax=Rhodopirellula sp. JB044 TaxID=3342844 RepID=UPI00370BEB21